RATTILWRYANRRRPWRQPMRLSWLKPPLLFGRHFAFAGKPTQQMARDWTRCYFTPREPKRTRIAHGRRHIAAVPQNLQLPPWPDDVSAERPAHRHSAGEIRRVERRRDPPAFAMDQARRHRGGSRLAYRHPHHRAFEIGGAQGTRRFVRSATHEL